jgi:hypothetical protein
MDGEKLADSEIKLSDDGKQHSVRIILEVMTKPEAYP